MDQPSNSGNGRNFSEVGSFFPLAKEKKDPGGVFEASRKRKLQERGRRLIWSLQRKPGGTKISTFGCRSAIPAETKVIRPLYEAAWKDEAFPWP